MTDDNSHDIDTLAVHAAQPPDAQTGAVTPPIHLSTTFAQPAPGEHRGFEYGRTDNPNRRALEGCVAALEGGRYGIAFASGSAATAALLQTLSPGEHVVACDDVYGGTHRIMERLFVPVGVEVSWVDMTDLINIERAIRPETRFLWVESPTNPLLKVVDIRAVADRVDVPVIVDNTFATPVLQRPLSLGAHAVVHSTTKYLNGHADVIGGVVITDDQVLADRLHYIQNAAGAVPSPFDCYLTLRGIKTLPIRMRRQCETAGSIAQWLEAHPRVQRVLYPGLPSHPQHEVASRQMALPGAMISAVIEGGLDEVRAALCACRLFALAESLGGVESLVEHPASMTHAAIPLDIRQRVGISDGLVRFSIGLESEGDLRADLAQALA